MVRMPEDWASIEVQLVVKLNGELLRSLIIIGQLIEKSAKEVVRAIGFIKERNEGNLKAAYLWYG